VSAGGGNGGQQISERNGLPVRQRVLPGRCRSEKMEMGRGRRSSGDDGLLGQGRRSSRDDGLLGRGMKVYWVAVSLGTTV
jgi:hypothetical protein